MSDHRRHDHYRAMYLREDQPWNYSGRGAEVLRHGTIAEVLKGARGRYVRALDVGCSQGQLTAALADIADEVAACDVSLDALRRAREAVVEITRRSPKSV